VTRLRPLLPYALASVLVVVSSVVALAVSLPRDGATAGGIPTAAPRRDVELSPTARVAYWREAPSGEWQLWVGDLDGRRRWTVATAAPGAELALTRWSPRGDAVGYVEGATRLVVVGLDGTRIDLPPPKDAPAERRGIVSFHWSPDATRIAASARLAGGRSNESDVYVIEVRAGAEWVRETELGDAYAGPWISADELFVETGTGLIGILRPGARDLHPIIGMPAASPMLGQDGRVYFAGGGWVRADLGAAPYASGSIWSVTLDGDDLRHEAAASFDAVRLQGRLADGRFVVGMPGSAYLATDEIVPFPWSAGTIRRVVVTADGGVLGLTDDRVIRLDPSTLTATVATPDAAMVVLLDRARAADIWSPSRPLAAVRSSPRPPEGPPARLAFVLGRTLWQMDRDGRVRALLSPPAQGWISGAAWSPDGGRLAVIVSEGGRWPPNATVLIIDRNGRSEMAFRGGDALSWSPDGRSLAVTSARYPGSNEWEILLYDLERGVPEAIPGRQAAWTRRGLVVLGNGTASSGNWRIGQTLELIEGDQRRTITTSDRLAAHPKLRGLPGADLPRTAITWMYASPDGELVGVALARLNDSVAKVAFAVIRASDGEPLLAFDSDGRDGVSGLMWSPEGKVVGHSVAPAQGFPASPDTAGKALVRDARTWAVLAEAPGRFAGWAPDGEWWFVARNEGLFAYRLDGSGGIRVSPYGVNVSAARP